MRDYHVLLRVLVELYAPCPSVTVPSLFFRRLDVLSVRIFLVDPFSTISQFLVLF